MGEHIKIKANYPFWRHPFKWLKDRKYRIVMEKMVNMQWENGMKQEIEKMQMDLAMKGTAIMKGGKRIDPDCLACRKKDSRMHTCTDFR